MKTFFSKKRNILICVLAVALVLAGSVTGVYAYGVHVENENARIEAERLEQRLIDIDADLADAAEKVMLLYSDDALEYLAGDIQAEDFTSAKQSLDAVAGYADEDEDMTDTQRENYSSLLAEYSAAKVLYEVQEGLAALDLTCPSEEAAAALRALSGQLEEVKDTKPAAYALYNESIAQAQGELDKIQAVVDTVNALFDSGEVAEDTTREEYEEVVELVDALENEELKAELTELLQQVDECLTEREELAEKERKAATGSSNQSSTANNASGVTNGTPPAAGSGTTANTPPAAETPAAQTPAPETPTEVPPAPAPEPVVEEPYIVSGYIGNSGMEFGSSSEARAWAYTITDSIENWNSMCSSLGFDPNIGGGFWEITVVYSDGSYKYTIDFYAGY